MTPSSPERQRNLDVIIPFYRNADLVVPLFESLQGLTGELSTLGCSLVAVNDSPGDLELRAALDTALGALPPDVPCHRIDNPRNLGFIQSANAGLERAVGRRHDAMLLNSDTVLFPGVLAEMRRVAYMDPMIGFVSPRSNNAAICSLPHQKEFRDVAPAEAFRNFERLSRHLRDFQFIPAAVGFCMLIKWEVLAEFGLLDEAYGQGYNEENDLIMRANRCGYRSAVANRAFAYHAGSRSFALGSEKPSALEEKNAVLLNKRYPEYLPLKDSYAAGSQYAAERMLSALLPEQDGRYSMVFDLSSVGPYHNGTYEACKQILLRAAEEWKKYFHIHIMCSEEAMRFHHLDKLPVGVVPLDTARTFALALRFGQPFDWQQMARLSEIGVVNVYAMLDPIAADCFYLSQGELDSLWGSVFSHADGVVYISEFVAEQFRRRFRLRPGIRELVSYLSLNVRDYRPAGPAAAVAGRHILVMGNAFEHKFVRPTALALRKAFPEEKIVAFGLEERIAGVTSYGSGYLPDATVKQLLREAKFVVYPSMYEGFGIPVVESLAYRKPVLARAIPAMREIGAKLNAGENLILFESTRDLIERLEAGLPVWREYPQGEAAGNDWSAVTRRLGEWLRELIPSVSVEDVLRPRLEHFRFLSPENGQTAPNTTALVLALRNRVKEVQDLRHSWSWRITSPVRRLADFYFRLAGRNAPHGR